MRHPSPYWHSLSRVSGGWFRHAFWLFLRQSIGQNFQQLTKSQRMPKCPWSPGEFPWGGSGHVARGPQDPLSIAISPSIQGRWLPANRFCIEICPSPRKIEKHNTTTLVIALGPSNVQSNSHVAPSSWAGPYVHDVWKHFVLKASFTKIMFLCISWWGWFEGFRGCCVFICPIFGKNPNMHCISSSLYVCV